MLDKSGAPLANYPLTEKEKRLIELCRSIGYGQIVIYCEQGQPVRIEEMKKSIKL